MQPASPDVLGRARRWAREQLAFLAVLVVLLGALLYLLIDSGRWGRASGLMAVAVLLAGVLRAAIPTRRIGLLAARGRVIDSILYLVLGGLILAMDLRLHG